VEALLEGAAVRRRLARTGETRPRAAHGGAGKEGATAKRLTAKLSRRAHGPHVPRVSTAWTKEGETSWSSPRAAALEHLSSRTHWEVWSAAFQRGSNAECLRPRPCLASTRRPDAWILTESSARVQLAPQEPAWQLLEDSFLLFPRLFWRFLSPALGLAQASGAPAHRMLDQVPARIDNPCTTPVTFQYRGGSSFRCQQI
jgi:hypothetical protein